MTVAQDPQQGTFDQTPRTSLHRLPERGEFRREEIYAILDEGLVCHVGFAVDGQPYVIPTGYVRVGDTLYIHGSAASRMLRQLSGGLPVCVNVTLLDGLVLARSAFNHSMNYRSVVVLGTARLVDDARSKMAALRAFTEHVLPGRWDEVRQPNKKEFAATTVLAVQLAEASAKIRTGPPHDDAEDLALPVWAGVVPLVLHASAPIPDPDLRPGIDPPPGARAYTRPKK